jgi:hypothetical protein
MPGKSGFLQRRKQSYREQKMTIESRLITNRIPQRLLQDLATDDTGVIYQPDVSAWVKGRPITGWKQTRLMQVLEDIELMLGVFAVRPDLSDAVEVRKLIVRAKQQVALAERGI